MSISRIDDEDPVLGDALTFLANDIQKHPEQVKPISSALFSSAKSLVSGVEIDLDAPLSDKYE